MLSLLRNLVGSVFRCSSSTKKHKTDQSRQSGDHDRSANINANSNVTHVTQKVDNSEKQK